ncbi:AAEL010264-PA [Aedes aegypti]|uniref:AAEL010264-PA n=2 Tax=Aedes aegypti TaxID=7159 RepID=A0A1S4FPS8_AEDAE|nr:vegetative cell wall protein gp1 [Aedes aegypti]EAT37774.1 AAEL010264-PA [Aedes aegypti]
MKLLIGLLLVGLAIEGRAQLTCFVCENCGDPFDRAAHTAQTCPQPVPTIVTPPIETTTTAIPPTPPSPDGPTLTPPPPVTTAAPGPTPGPTPAPNPDPTPELTPPPVGRRKRQANQLSHRCFIMTHNGVTRRGCTAHGNDWMETCRNNNNGQQPNECRLCDWSECNSASGLTVSIVTLSAAVLIALKFF